MLAGSATYDLVCMMWRLTIHYLCKLLTASGNLMLTAGRRGGLVVEHRTPEPEVVVQSSLGSPCCIHEQDTFISQKVLVIPRKWWLRPDMTEKSLTGT